MDEDDSLGKRSEMSSFDQIDGEEFEQVQKIEGDNESRTSSVSPVKNEVSLMEHPGMVKDQVFDNLERKIYNQLEAGNQAQQTSSAEKAAQSTHSSDSEDQNNRASRKHSIALSIRESCSGRQ